MMRSPDRIVLAAGALLLLVLVLWQIAAASALRREVRETHARATRFAEKVNANDLPPPMKNPSLESGRVMAAWEKLPLSTRTLDMADFTPATFGYR